MNRRCVILPVTRIVWLYREDFECEPKNRNKLAMKAFGDRDTHFEALASAFNEHVTDLLPVPPYAEVSRNLVSMGNFLPLIEKIVKAKSPKNICEIGAYRGITTKTLLTLAERIEATLHVVDPISDFLTNIGNSKRLVHHKMLSEEFLANTNDIQIYFIDGDHNYEVVSIELDLISSAASKDNSPLIFMHDVGWPWGYRDLYYDPCRIEKPHELSASNVLNLASSDEFEISIPVEENFAASAGGKHNGVRCAVDDFLSSQSGWKFFSIPSLFGLGVLYNQEQEGTNVLEALEELENGAKLFGPFLSILELNRLLLLSEINVQGKVWEDNQSYIKEVDNRVAMLQTLRGSCKQLAKRLLRRT